jgi:ribosomal protein S18 acetylase RimI-like enzyme
MNLRMNDSIVIRSADDRDRDFVAGLASALLQFGSPVWDDPAALAPGFREVLAGAVCAQDERSTVLIAQRPDGTPVGFISLKLIRGVGAIERAHVADLAVIEEARKMGIGRALMQAGEAWAEERGLRVLSLDVWSTNARALAFYRRLGYDAESLCLVKRLG